LSLCAKLFSQAVVRGTQLTLGLIFLKKGIELIINKDIFMSGLQGKFSEYPIDMILGIVVFDLVLLMLILPQIPLTIGNACVGTADTCTSLFMGNPQLSKTKAGKFAFSMGIMNLPGRLLGAVPMCHGTGGLAAHFRFGARTGGAPIMIGIFFIVVALVLGELGFSLLAIIPQSVLGVLLVFAGLELCPLLRSLKTNEEYFIALLIVGIALAIPNMGWAFGIATDIL
jgi:sulfate permease, SulP family